MEPAQPKFAPIWSSLLACSRLCLILLLVSTVAHPGHASPMSPDDNFVPACGGLLPDPPPGGWLPWSSPATWGGGGVPGIGSALGANVTIPCGAGVLLDLPLVQLTVLNILGALKLRDDPSLPLVNLTAAFIIVEGRFIAGNASNQFSQRAEIRLTPNPNNRAPFLYSSRLPADPANPRSVGHKAFAVIGGQVDFHGLPGPASMLTWTKLVSSAQVGNTVITVKGDVSTWPVGSPVVIAPTDFYPDQEDVCTITARVCSSGTCQLTLDRPLTYNHYGNPLGVPDGFGGYIDETAEVALLTRNIVITGTDEPIPNNYEGGHFIVFFTNTRQILEGVQFLRMGQQGTLGRYNIHFHLCGNQENNSIVRKNLMMHSKQRCVVVHATFNLTIDGNVAYNTSGHCFMLEEGGETGNTFTNNFGLRTRAVDRKIAADETDDSPSTFWITNPNNNYINNAAGGSDDSGFWLELRDAVRGFSLKWAKVNQTVPISVATVGKFVGNNAHSNLFAGYRAYPHGFVPRFNATQDNRNWDKPVWVELGNFNLWKNMQVGAFIHDADHVVFSNSSFADNVKAIHLNEVQGINVTGHRIVGESNNYGTPQNCQYDWGKWSCGPINGCAFPLAPGVPGRSVPWGLANQSMLGVVFDQNRQHEDGSMVTLLSNTTFSSFNSSCHVSAAVAVGKGRANFWNSGHGFRSLKFSTSTVTNRIYLFPKTAKDGDSWVDYTGEPATMYAIRDLDGSITGTPGYVVANNPSILPPSSFTPKCTSLAQGNALACPGTCYRTVQVLFFEPEFSPYPKADWGQWVDGPRALGDYSYIKVTRVEDGTTFTMEGNLRQYRTFDNGGGPYNDTARTFPMSLLSGYTYEITIVAGRSNAAFVPQAVVLHYKDGPGCGGGVTVRILGSSAGSYTWAVQPTDVTSWSPCPGNAAVLTTAVAPAQYSYACTSSTSPSTQALAITLSPQLQPMTDIVVVPVAGAPSACSSTSTRCGLTATHTLWAYNQQNQNLQAAYADGPAFYNPLYPTPAPAWASGPGVLGYEGWEFSGISTFLRAPDWSNLRTYYFKSSFNLTRSSCYSALFLDVVVLDGLVLYLNNLEVLRVNMPAGTPTNMTQASSKVQGPDGDPMAYRYSSFSIPLSGTGVKASLAEGRNHFAAEVHVNVDNGWNVGFALRASLAYNPSCTAPKVAPEVCDGVDNNGDGAVDVDPATNKLLQRPCSTACGSGVFTCTNGAFQNCSAPPVRQEICNGRDDNCDGLIDNGNAQLDCAAGNVCFNGTCRLVQELTTQQQVWQAKAPGWVYLENAASPGPGASWRNGTRTGGTWKTGAGDFGVFPDNTAWGFATALTPNSNGNMYTRYFVKNFTLTAANAKNTFGYRFGLRRCDGAVVYLNGRELFRSNMPAGTVSFTTLASSWSAGQDPTWDTNAVVYYPFGPLRAYGVPTITGNNWIGVELHGSGVWQSNWVFDLSLTRFVIQPCPGTAACVRRPPQDTAFVSQGDTWRFLDASLPLPPSNWTRAGFNDASWLAGRTRIGEPSWVQTRMTTGAAAGNGRTTYYFRKTFSAPDGACFFNFTMNLFANDGAVVYINGAEAARSNMPAGIVTATTAAAGWPSWQWRGVSLGGGWLKAGTNVVAVEVHQFPQTTDGWLFNLDLTGQREGVSCSPLPA